MTLPATPKGSWISKELKQVYGARRFKAGKGVDLNGNGRLEKKEKIATYNRNKIPGNDTKVIGDWTDWLAFYRANYKTIHAKTRTNKNSIFFWAGKLKTTNPLHIITSVESPVVKQSDVLKAYKKTWKIIARARKTPLKGTTALQKAQSKLVAIYKTMMTSGIKIRVTKSDLFITDIVNNVLDCDTSGFLFLAEAHEKNWPLFGAHAPGHFFVRWKNPRSKVVFNMETTHRGRFQTDAQYKRKFKIQARAVRGGTYLRNLDLTGLIALALKNRALTYQNMKKLTEALRDYNQALKLDRTYAAAHVNRGNTYISMGKPTFGVKDFNQAIKLDPGCSDAFNNRGLEYLRMGKLALAQKDFLNAIRISATPSKQRSKLGKVLFKIGVALFKDAHYMDAERMFRILRVVQPKHFTVNALIKRSQQCKKMPLKCISSKQKSFILDALLAALKTKGMATKPSEAIAFAKGQSWKTLTIIKLHNAFIAALNKQLRLGMLRPVTMNKLNQAKAAEQLFNVLKK